MIRALLLALVCVGCSQPIQVSDACPAATEAEVQQAFTTWTEAYSAKNLEGVMAIFDRNVVFEFQGAPNASYDELEAAFRADFERLDPGNSQWVAEPDSIMLSGEMANVISTWRQQVTTETGIQTRQTNRAIDVLTRGGDCRWRIARSLNYPLTPVAD
jgi:uncharacterized protein (TIGR02246 family)